MKRLLLLGMVIAMASSGSAQLDTKVNSSCGPEYEALISMHELNSTNSHPRHPGVHDNKICVKGLAESTFDTECEGATAFFVSSNSSTAHFSSEAGYNFRVCTGNVLTEIRSSCQPNEEPLFKVSERINGFGRHVAGPLFENYSSVVCGRFAPPENVSLTVDVSMDPTTTAFFDGREISSGFTFEGLAEFPYLVRTNGDRVAGLVADGFREAEYDTSGQRKLTLKRASESASYLLVYTRGSEENIEDEEEEVLDGEFLRELNPSFGDFEEGEPYARALLEPGTEIDSDVSIGSGNYDITIRKIEDGRVEITSE